MSQIILNIGGLISKVGKFLAVPLLLIFTFNAHRYADPALAPKFFLCCMLLTMSYMLYIIISLLRQSDYRAHFGVILILLATNALLVKMFVTQALHLVGIKNTFFNNYETDNVDTWFGFAFLAMVSLWVIYRTHKWRSDLIQSHPYNPNVVMFGGKIPKTWRQFWISVFNGDAFSAHIATIHGKTGKFSSRKSIFTTKEPTNLDEYTLRRAEDIDPREFELYLDKRNGEITHPLKNNCLNWGKYDVRKYFK